MIWKRYTIPLRTTINSNPSLVPIVLLAMQGMFVMPLIITRAISLKALAKQYEKVIKDALEGSPVLEGEHKRVSSKLQTRYKYNTPDVVEYLLNNGVDNKAILKWGLTVNNTSLTKLFKKINAEHLDDGVPCEVSHDEKLQYESKAKLTKEKE